MWVLRGGCAFSPALAWEMQPQIASGTPVFPWGSKADGLVPPDIFLSPKALSKVPTCPFCSWWTSSPCGAQASPGRQASRAHIPTAALLPFLLDLQMLQKLREDEPQSEKPLMELDSLGRTDWVRRGPRWPGAQPGSPARG